MNFIVNKTGLVFLYGAFSHFFLLSVPPTRLLPFSSFSLSLSKSFSSKIWRPFRATGEFKKISYIQISGLGPFAEMWVSKWPKWSKCEYQNEQNESAKMTIMWVSKWPKGECRNDQMSIKIMVNKTMYKLDVCMWDITHFAKK